MLLHRNEITGDIQTMKFLFPTYDIINDDNIPMFPEKPAIFVGSQNKKEDFIKKYSDTMLDFYVMVPNSEVDLNSRNILLQIVCEKWRKRTVPKFISWIMDPEKLDDATFMKIFKHKWVTGKWLDEYKKERKDDTFLDLVDNINSSKLDLIRTYCEVVKETRPYRLESSLMTFLLRAKDNSYHGRSFNYRNKIQLYKGNKLEAAKIAIEKVLPYNIDNYTLRLLVLLVALSDSNRH